MKKLIVFMALCLSLNIYSMEEPLTKKSKTNFKEEQEAYENDYNKELKQYFYTKYAPHHCNFGSVDILEGVKRFVNVVNLLEKELCETNISTDLSDQIKQFIIINYKITLKEFYVNPDTKGMTEDELNKSLFELIRNSYRGAKDNLNPRNRELLGNAEAEKYIATYIIAGANPNLIKDNRCYMTTCYWDPSLLGLILLKELNSSLIDLLFYYGADFNIKDNFGFHPIIFPIKKNNTELLRKVINYGAKVNKKFSKFYYYFPNYSKNRGLPKCLTYIDFPECSTVLMVASYAGLSAMVEILLNQPNININHKNVKRITALRYACHGLLEINKFYSEIEEFYKEFKALFDTGKLEPGLDLSEFEFSEIAKFPSKDNKIMDYIKTIKMLLEKGGHLGLKYAKSEALLNEVFEFLKENFIEGLEILPSKEEMLKSFGFVQN